MRNLAMFLFAVISMPLATWAQDAPEQSGSQSSSATPIASPQDRSGQSTPSASPTIPDSTAVVLIHKQNPVYPLEARKEKLQGRVVVRLLINENGEVESTEIVSGNPVLASAAADAMKKWKFKPYIRNGHAVKARTSVPWDFAFSENIHDEASAAIQNPPDGGKSAVGEAPLVRLRVSQGVLDGKLLHRVQPVYPPEARRKYIQGDVLLQAIIGKDGLLKDLKLISGPAELAEAAMGAVQQWRYRPFLLKGEPVEVETIITVKFHM